MKKDKKQTIKEMNEAELNKRVSAILKEIAEAKMQFMSGKLKNVHTMKALKQELAMIKTVQTQKKSVSAE